ncbi:DMT family transporter [Ectobacillus panaciterrae]|uniref:DMT family transporter n=1 Tax=Ectobacillus panaciterrae TaxID=363872 RepID=UPI00048FCD28|nr:DMT family transporter [Ectobacillus panaciterrae]
MFSLLALLAGLALGIQAPINGGLGKRIGALEGALASFLVGTLALIILVLFFGKGSIGAFTSIPKWQLAGGLLGALYVAISVMVVPKIGVASTLVAIIVGQMIMGSVIDHFALFGGKHIPFDMKRLAALVLLGGALYLFYKK